MTIAEQAQRHELLADRATQMKRVVIASIIKIQAGSVLLHRRPRHAIEFLMKGSMVDARSTMRTGSSRRSASNSRLATID